jgi:hypothetical protein
MSIRILASFIIGNLISNSLLVAPASAQSLDLKKPAPLEAGLNSGTADSMVGAHYWFFYAEPGSFSGTVTKLDSPGDAARAQLSAGISYAPKLPENTLVSKDSKDKTNFSGTVKTRSKVILKVDPGPAGLTRSACNYNVVVNGNVSFGQATSTPEIVGTYMGPGDLNLTKFNPDGTFIAQTGIKGKWTLFDADTKTYAVDYNKSSLSLKLVPARGLTDAQNADVIIFKLLH